jgi:hypothetical protein
MSESAFFQAVVGQTFAYLTMAVTFFMHWEGVPSLVMVVLSLVLFVGPFVTIMWQAFEQRRLMIFGFILIVSVLSLSGFGLGSEHRLSSAGVFFTMFAMALHAYEQFYLSEPNATHRPVAVIIWSTYYCGQVLMAMGFVAPGLIGA